MSKNMGSGIGRSFKHAAKVKERMEKGLCVRCGKKNDTDLKNCPKCLEYYKEENKRK